MTTTTLTRHGVAQMHAIVCSWCKRTIRFSHTANSHGMCRSCADQWLQDLKQLKEEKQNGQRIERLQPEPAVLGGAIHHASNHRTVSPVERQVDSYNGPVPPTHFEPSEQTELQ